jgi:hypothetical protein
MLSTENDYHSRGLIAITISDDPWFHLTRDAVQEVAAERLGIPRGDINVDFYPPKGFLLLLRTPALWDCALPSNGGLIVGRTKL